MIELKAYAGLIRNYRELAAELGVDIAGMTRTQREEALVTAAYRTWGTDMGAHINGQFGIVLYDAEAEQLFATRDPLGAELLFYYQTADGSLLAATQITDLFDQPGFVRELNTAMVPYFLGFTYVPGEDTLFKGVHKLEPGGFLTFDEANGLALGRYWELTFEPDETKTLDDWADELEAAMEASLHDICDEDEQPDSFLSGGVDSSYILAKSRARTGFCAAYANQEASEEAEARATAEYLGRGFEGVIITPEEFLATVDEFLLAYEQPSADVAGLSLYCAAKQMATMGKSSLCFSGEGADEFFAGYSIYRNTKRLQVPGAVYYGATFIMNEKEQSRYLKQYGEGQPTDAFMRERGAGGRGYDTLGWMLYTDLRSYFEGSILFNSTRIANGTGLDIRMPYCDLRIFDIARRMPSRFKTTEQGNKIALRAAASRVLPHEVAYRKKLGFPVPVREWLSRPDFLAEITRAFGSEAAGKFFKLDELKALLDAFQGKKPGKHRIWFARRPGLLWRHVWTIYIFIRWYELFFEA